MGRELQTLRAALRLEQQHSANLARALLNSREIGVAIGVLMSTYKLPHDEALALLRCASKFSNRKLRYVAGDVILTGTLPQRAPSTHGTFLDR